MRENARVPAAGWLPLRDSYEEAVLTWYEQVENSFRRRERDSGRALVGATEAARDADGSPRVAS
jgi:hypothetical protein